LVNLHDYFSYNPETGVVAWKIARNNRVKIDEEAGSLNTFGYRRVYLFGKCYYTHRLAWFLYYGDWPEELIDHINGDPSDNRISNLREASSVQNSLNRKRSIRNTSGVKGITWHKRDKRWQAILERNNRTIFIGYFKSLLDAKRAVEKRRLELDNEFSNHG
jgi:hypothetical protein